MSYQRNFNEKNQAFKPETDSIFEELETTELASKWVRLANFVIDLIVIQIILVIIGTILAILETGDFFFMENKLLDYLIGAIVGSAYYVIIESNTGGRSIGKYITNTKVVTVDDETPDFHTYATRSLCRYIPFNPISFIGEHSTGWHDSISKTKVIKM